MVAGSQLAVGIPLRGGRPVPGPQICGTYHGEREAPLQIWGGER